jgi:hypothetical protein
MRVEVHEPTAASLAPSRVPSKAPSQAPSGPSKEELKPGHRLYQAAIVVAVLLILVSFWSC